MRSTHSALSWICHITFRHIPLRLNKIQLLSSLHKLRMKESHNRSNKCFTRCTKLLVKGILDLRRQCPWRPHADRPVMFGIPRQRSVA